MGWLPWTRDEVEPPPRTGARAVSPWRRVRQEQEARIAAVEREHREYVELQKKQEQEREDERARRLNLPSYRAKQDMLILQQRRARIEEEAREERRKRMEEEARLKEEAEEREARKQECRTKLYNTLLEFLQEDDVSHHKASEIVLDAWYGAQERLERRKYHRCDELFEDLLEDIDTELVTLHDLSCIILNRAQNDAEFNVKMKRQERAQQRDQVFIGNPNEHSYRKSQSRPLIQPHSAERERERDRSGVYW